MTTGHAKKILTSKGPESFTSIYDLEPFQQMMINIASETEQAHTPSLRVTGMPGKHIPMAKPIEKLNELVGAVRPPANLPSILPPPSTYQNLFWQLHLATFIDLTPSLISPC